MSTNESHYSENCVDQSQGLKLSLSLTHTQAKCRRPPALRAVGLEKKRREKEKKMKRRKRKKINGSTLQNMMIMSGWVKVNPTMVILFPTRHLLRMRKSCKGKQKERNVKILLKKEKRI